MTNGARAVSERWASRSSTWTSSWYGPSSSCAAGSVIRRTARYPFVSIGVRAPELTTWPSGRWSVLRGDVEEGDYIHARLLLLDRDKGELFRIAESRSWPPPLRPKGKHGLPQIKTPVATIDVIGESDVRWLGSSAESELLVVDSLVVKPGHYAFSVDGEIAR